MSQKALMLLPVIGLFFLTAGIALWMLKLRYRAVLKDGVNPRYFKLNKGAKLPDYVVQVTQHYENLFETPLLFYVAIILVLVLDLTDIGYVVLSWLYLISRLAHAYIHTTYNKLMHRKNVFIVSGVVLFVLWLRLLLSIVAS